ncbi:glycoside hydrolase family 71/99-like protein [Mucilaginibacter terrae]|nr:glycoside hydrolase family 71/99-like protein [Mucilaginibacter terrae]
MSYKGLVMAGYQGWFNSPDDGAKRGWNHYVASGRFEPGNCKIDMWPDVSEYSKVYPTAFTKADGSPTHLFSSYDVSTVQLHFKWMKDYGVDGVFMQRFFASINSDKDLAHTDKVLSAALQASQKNRRAISVMYDLSGMEGDEGIEVIIKDWKHLVDDLKLTSKGVSQTYLYHNQRPLIAIWGVGFKDRNYTLKAIDKLLDFLKNNATYGGCSVLLGVPAFWRDLKDDAVADSDLHDLIRKADIVQPWFVGRYNEQSYARFNARIIDDLYWCKLNHVDYVPVVYPGFSWHNMYPRSPFNQIPRNRGQFYWKQIAGSINAGAQMLYIAMFDEIDEGTAIFKISKDPPIGKSVFITFEQDIPGDYYLFLTGYAGEILKGSKTLSLNVPLKP